MVTFKQIHEIEQLSQDDWYELLKERRPHIPSCISYIEGPKGLTEQNGTWGVVLWVSLEDSEGNICTNHPVFIPLYDVFELSSQKLQH